MAQGFVRGFGIGIALLLGLFFLAVVGFKTMALGGAFLLVLLIIGLLVNALADAWERKHPSQW